MTQTEQTVLERYQVRKSKRQKSAFIDYVTAMAQENGYSCKTEKGYLGARNILIGDPDTAKVLYTAHYDTCARMPFPNFITPKHILLYILYQVMLATVLFAVPVLALELGIAWTISYFEIDSELLLVLFPSIDALYALTVCWLLLAGPANRHTANDNTSGVNTILELMCALPPDARANAAFVLFDLEEAGLFGSMGFASRHGAHLKQTPVINFDCVSDGENILFAVRRTASHMIPLLQTAYTETEHCRTDIVNKGVFYPSDQMNFPCGIGVAALKRTKRGNILYMDRIHTKHDTVYREENIAFLVTGSIKLTELINQRENV